MFITDWFKFLLDFGNSLEPYVTLVIFSAWLSYLSRQGEHLLSYVSFLESVAGFLMVIVSISLYKVNISVENLYVFYTFLSYVGVLWGTQGLIWGSVFYVTPIEEILRLEKKMRGKKFTYF